MPKWWATSWITVMRTCSHHLGLVGAHGEDRPPEDADPVGHHHRRRSRRRAGERHAVVEPEQRRALAPLPHHDRHVVDQPPQVVGDLVEGVRHQLLEPLQRHLHHRAQRRVAVDGPRGAPRRARRRPASGRDLHGDAPGGARARPARARPGCSPAGSPTGSPPASADPRHVLALTFTRKAAGELDERLAPPRPAGRRHHRHLPRRRLGHPAHPVGRPGRSRPHPARPQGPPPDRAGAVAARQGQAHRRRRAGHRDRVGQGPHGHPGRLRGRGRRGRRASRRCGPTSSPRSTPATRTASAAAAWSTSTTCSRWSPGPWRTTRRSRPPSAGGSATSSSTSSRT